MKIDLAREIALKALYKIEKENAYSNLVLDEIIKENKSKLTSVDIGFISELVYGITTYRITLDYIISKYSKTKINKISIFAKNILRMGIYQIIFLSKVPKSAAVNESVNLAKKYANKSSGFINAILRKVSLEDYNQIDNIKDEKEKISIKYSMPKWIIEELSKEFKLEEVEKICINSNLKPRTTIRVNTIKIKQEEFIKIFNQKNIKYEKTEINNFIYLDNLKNISELEEFKKGYFTIQDLAAGLTSIILAPKKGETILDACSAPGGKTTHLAEIMENMGEITAWDLYKSRLNLVNENAKRLGINIIKADEKDAGEFENTVIVMLADHYPYGLSKSQIAEIIDHELGDYEIEKTPLVIYNPEMTSKSFTEYSSYINLVPTIANLMNLDYDPRLYMGSDLLSEDYESMVVFADGSWKNEKAYYNASTSKIKYYGEELYTSEEIQEINNKVSLKIQMSSTAIKNNYFNYLEKKLDEYEQTHQKVEEDIITDDENTLEEPNEAN